MFYMNQYPLFKIEELHVLPLPFISCIVNICAVFPSQGWQTGCMNFSLTRKEELAAVIVPWGLMKAAFSLLICSMVDGLIPLSLTTVSATPVNNKGRTKTGLIKIKKFLRRQFKAFLNIPLIDNISPARQAHLPGTLYGRTSDSSPFSDAQWALEWDLKAYSSC